MLLFGIVVMKSFGKGWGEVGTVTPLGHHAMGWAFQPGWGAETPETWGGEAGI